MHPAPPEADHPRLCLAALGFGSDQVAGDNLAFQSLYFIGLLLFILTLLLNVASGWLVNRVREVY